MLMYLTSCLAYGLKEYVSMVVYVTTILCNIAMNGL